MRQRPGDSAANESSCAGQKDTNATVVSMGQNRRHQFGCVIVNRLS
jgi:hypothetical protein